MAWTLFWDMHSGGGTKVEPYTKIYIEAPKDEAVNIFYNRFGRNPYRVTCTCCGEDYSVDESDTLENASGFHRGCDYAYFDTKGREVSQEKAWTSGVGLRRGYSEGYVERPSSNKYATEKYMSIEEYSNREDVLVIPASEIKDEERQADVPDEGYVWV